MSLEKRTNVQTFLQTYQVSTLVVHDLFLLLVLRLTANTFQVSSDFLVSLVVCKWI